jgi:hypothetical protein
MKVYALYFVFIVGSVLPSLSSAQELSNWLVNLKREVTKLGINERGYLHSIGHIRNSVLQAEDVFFVSAMHFEELDIELLPDGNVEVSRDWKKSSQSVKPGSGRKASGVAVKSCENLSGNSPRLSLVKAQSSRLLNDLTSRENNLLTFVENYISGVLVEEENVAWSPYSGNLSRYENMLQGSHFEEARHKLSLRVQYDEVRQVNKFGRPRSHRISVELRFLEDNEAVKAMSSVLVLARADLSASGLIKEKLDSSSSNELKKLSVRIDSFLSELPCLTNYSNLVVASNGRLLLDSGTDAGFNEGDQLLLMPKAVYFKKRGLLAGVDQIAIARVKKIGNLQSELEIEEGEIRFEDGIEFFARPLLELI